MVPFLRILGIETSCDETAAAVVERDAQRHGRRAVGCRALPARRACAYGGVVPEIAARAHVEALDELIEEALKRANVSLDDVDAIAATSGPGLIGGLLVGLMTGKAIARARRQAALCDQPSRRPCADGAADGRAFLSLSDAACFRRPYASSSWCAASGEYERWGTTIDDALGEAFDKTAKLLGLPYPGGPAVERMAQAAIPIAFDFPRPLVGEAAARFLLLRPEDGGAAGGAGYRAAQRSGCRGYLRLVPEGGFADAEGPYRPRPAAVQDGISRRYSLLLAESRRWSLPAVSPPISTCATRCRRSATRTASASSRRRCTSAPTMP